MFDIMPVRQRYYWRTVVLNAWYTLRHMSNLFLTLTTHFIITIEGGHNIRPYHAPWPCWPSAAGYSINIQLFTISIYFQLATLTYYYHPFFVLHCHLPSLTTLNEHFRPQACVFQHSDDLWHVRKLRLGISYPLSFVFSAKAINADLSWIIIYISRI